MRRWFGLCSQLPGFWVGGSLSPAVGKLTYLTLLDLNSNNMTGPMPAEIVNLNQVQVLPLCST